MTLIPLKVIISLKRIQSMKTLQNQGNPTKTQLLTWVNTTQPPSLPKVKQIGQLGNGVAYLHLLLRICPGSLRPEKICKSPTTSHDIRNNISLLLSTFQKLDLPYKFEVDKIAQMKYQDNFHLATFLFKLQQKNKEKEDPSKSNDQKSKVKVIVPANLKPVPIKKEEPPHLTPSALASLTHPEQPKEVLEAKKDSQRQEKVEKIANMLKISNNSGKKSGKVVAAKSCIVEQSYRRILRKTFCDQSKYLNSYPVMNSFKDYQEWNDPHAPSQLQHMKYYLRDEESMLLSSNKNQMLLSSNKKREHPHQLQTKEKKSEKRRQWEEEKGEQETTEEPQNGGQGEEEGRVI